MVLVADVGNFYIVPVQFLRDFFTVVDAVLDKSAAFDFPTVVNAAACGNACCDKCGKGAGSNLCENASVIGFRSYRRVLCRKSVRK
jgi:hypothetical protein